MSGADRGVEVDPVPMVRGRRARAARHRRGRGAAKDGGQHTQGEAAADEQVRRVAAPAHGPEPSTLPPGAGVSSRRVVNAYDVARAG